MPSLARWIFLPLLTLLLISQGSTISAHTATNSSSSSTPAFDLLSDSLIAEGDLNQSQLQRLQDTLLSKFDTIDKSIPKNWGTLTAESRIQLLFELMHQQILTGVYIENCSAMSVSIEHGDYNCVSATIIFQLLADRYQLPVVPVQTLGHVWSRSLTASATEIETTCPTWFQLEQSVRDNAPSAKAGKKARILSRRALVGKIYYNRATDQLAKQNYEDAISHLQTALTWDSADSAASGNLLAALNNWAIFCAQQGEFELANQKLDLVEQMDSSYQPLLQNRMYVRQCEVTKLCRYGRYQEALAKLVSAPGHNIELEQANQQTRLAIYDAWINSLLSANSKMDAHRVLDMAREELGDEQPRFIRLKLKYSKLDATQRYSSES